MRPTGAGGAAAAGETLLEVAAAPAGAHAITALFEGVDANGERMIVNLLTWLGDTAMKNVPRFSDVTDTFPKTRCISAGMSRFGFHAALFV